MDTSLTAATETQLLYDSYNLSNNSNTGTLSSYSQYLNQSTFNTQA